MGLSGGINGGSGGGPSPRRATVPANTTGVVASVSTGLKAPITVTRDSGSNAITFAAAGNRITASIAAALAAGASVSAIAKAVQADGTGVLIPFTLTGAEGGETPPPTPTPTPTPTAGRRLATNSLLPGNNGTAGTATASGSVNALTKTFVNNSGQPMTTAAPVLVGWRGQSSPYQITPLGQDVPVTVDLQYPAGTSVGTWSGIVPNGGSIRLADVALSAPIPAGATFTAVISTTITSGLYFSSGSWPLGLVSFTTTVSDVSTLKRSVFGWGDSILVNNDAINRVCAANGVPSVALGIIGMPASAFGSGDASAFDPAAKLAQDLGCYWLVCDLQANDGPNNSNLRGYLTALRDKARAYGLRYAQTTLTIRTGSTTTAEPVTSCTGSENTMVCAVTNPSRFRVGELYNIIGANEAAFNGFKFCTAVGAGTVSFFYSGATTGAATGTITIGSWKATGNAGFMVPNSGYEAGAASSRGQLNAWTRSGVFDSFIDWGDASEPSRDSGRWKVGGESPQLLPSQEGTITGLITSSRFNYAAPRIPSNSGSQGRVQFTSGAAIGQSVVIIGNGSSDITLSSAPTAAFAVGDTFRFVPGSQYMSDDGQHPRVPLGGYGAQPTIDNVTALWLEANT